VPKNPANIDGRKKLRLAAVPLAAILALCGCSRSGPKPWQGYLEGDFVYVASPLAGRLDKLSVTKGSRVAEGAPLFELERAAESDALRQAGQQLQAARDQLADLEKGSRPPGSARRAPPPSSPGWSLRARRRSSRRPPYPRATTTAPA
jgi:multidrug resistance efflux pump